MTSILDPSFKYIPAIETDLRRTFRRVRRQMSTQAHHDVNQLRRRSRARPVDASSLANGPSKGNEHEDSASPERRELRVMPL